MTVPTSTPLRIATRASALALWQARHIADRLRAISRGRPVELVEITTSGDRNQTDALSQFGGVGVFTREVQKALLDGRADLAVHSLKDLPTEPVDGLVLAAVPERAATHDALVLPQSSAPSDRSTPRSPATSTANPTAHPLAALPPAARVGTGSLRRRAQLLHHRPDLRLEEIRGNVDTRLRKLDEGQFDAIVLAEAGLTRLGLAARISARLTPPLVYPAVGQGALGLECRAEDAATRDLVAQLDHAETHASVVAERALLAALRAGCHAPLGVSVAEIAGAENENRLRMEAVVLSSDGARRIVTLVEGNAADPTALGQAAADDLRRQGAEELIAPRASG